MEQQFTLHRLAPGERATVKALGNREDMRRRLRDIGLIEGTEVECVGVSPGGDPSAYLIRGAVIAIRAEDAKKILLVPPSKEKRPWD